MTLDGFCRTHDLAPEVIKIDVEGGEIGVLEGAREVLSVHCPTIFLSVHPIELDLLGHATDSLARLIGKLGYSCHDVDGNPVARFGLDEYVLEPVTQDATLVATSACRESDGDSANKVLVLRLLAAKVDLMNRPSVSDIDVSLTCPGSWVATGLAAPRNGRGRLPGQGTRA